METTLTGLGAVVAVLTFLLGYAAIGVFRLTKKVEDLESRNFTRDMEFDNFHRDLDYRIEGDIRSLDISIQEVDKHLEREVIELYKQLDSRLDKFENRITTKIPPTNDELMERIKKIEEESYRLRMNL